MCALLDVDAVVFDCDGLLAETESGWTRAEAALFRQHGYDFGPEQKQLLVGGTLAAGAPALPGARAIAETLRDRGVPIAVASNSPRHFVDAALGSAGLLDLFEVIVSSDDVEHAKPAPDVIGVPSTPGAKLDAHLTYDSLAHAELRTWMASCTTRVHLG